jgi:hypothetical protein
MYDSVHRATLCNLLLERGGFTAFEILAALYGYGFGHERIEIERRIAMWLIGELQKLENWKAVSGTSPVRRGCLLSRLEIADVAIALLDYSKWCAFGAFMYGYRNQDAGDNPRPPTQELIDLLGRLLGVARHRKALADRQQEDGRFLLAAHIDAVAARRGETLSVKKLAGLAKVSTGSIVTWRRTARYKEQVKSRKRVGPLPPPPHPDAPPGWQA